MKNKNLCITKKNFFFLFMIMCILIFSLSLVIGADDDQSHTDGPGTQYETEDGNGRVGLTGEGGGTTYTIVDSNGNTYEYTLPAGTEVEGTDIKGYQTTGADYFDSHGDEYNLPDGTLELSREEWIVLAEANGDYELAESLRNGESFYGFTEQYLVISGQQVSATDAMKLYLSDPEKYDFIRVAIENSFQAFTEKDPEFMADYQRLLDGEITWEEFEAIWILGIGGYHYEGEDSGRPRPKPDLPYQLVYVGDYGCSKTPSTDLKIENTTFGVASGNPIPTSEELRIIGSTDLMGQINNIQKWELVITKPLKYTATAEWHWGYSRSYSYDYEVDIYEEKDGEKVKVGTETRTRRSSYSWSKNRSEPDVDGYNFSGIRDVYHSVSESSAPTIPGPGRESYKVTYSTSVSKISGVTVTNETLGGKITVNVNGPVLSVSGKSTIPGNSSGRVSYSTSTSLGRYSEYSDALAAVKAEAANPTMSRYWSVISDKNITVSGGGGSNSYGNNCPVLTGEMRTSRINIDELGVDKIDPATIENRSEGRNYPTTHAAHIIGGREMYPITGVNPVRVYTPIYNKITIECEGINQLKDASLAGGSKIVRLGDNFKAVINVKGERYYSPKRTSLDVSKYVKKVEYNCPMCCGTDEWKIATKVSAATYEHNCSVPVTHADKTSFTVRSRVTAENIGAGGEDLQTHNQINPADTYYMITQSDSVYVVGKIYDLQTRATDDPGWKDFVGTRAQNLSTLAVGEKGDNKLAAYKYGIKLGYRAFLDLKTLGISTSDVVLKPKIHYADVNGNDLTNNIELYYRTGPATYAKLTEKDIVINMTLNATQAAKYNSDYNNERLTTIKELNASLNFAKIDKIGGLTSGLVLDSDQAFMTKYKVNGTMSFLRLPNTSNSRRWYGEIYLPASTLVVQKGATLAEIQNGSKVMRNGYLIITFEDIYTRDSAKGTYLQYSMARDENGVEVDFSKSIMAGEKGGKNTLTLPNGKTFGGYIKTEAPVIIYDASLRANNDYESSGTH